MKVRLLRRWRSFEVGRVLDIFETTAKKMIKQGAAEKYDGEYPPKEKKRTDFFKPNKIKRNGKV